MRKLAIIAIVAAFLGPGTQYALDNRWWMVLACGLVGVLWLLPSKYRVELKATISFLFLGGASGAGTFLNYNPVWLLTNIVILLVAWDLDHSTRDLQPFSRDQTRVKDVSALFRTHLIRLGIVTGLGWSLGVVALIVGISLNFAGALVLGLLALVSLLQAVRILSREGDNENA